MSKGENLIEALLRKEQIYFIKEKTFNDLKGGKYRFDFFIPELNVIIEYDGEQHFKRVIHFQKQRKDFLRAQERDRAKNSYCLANKIKLYRIPFWEINNLKTIKDLFNSKFLVKDKFHNDRLEIPKELRY